MARRVGRLCNTISWLRHLRLSYITPFDVLTLPDAAPSPTLPRSFSKKAKKNTKPTKAASVRDILAELGDDFSLDDAEHRMKKSVEHLKGELANIRSGRATTGMLDHMTIDAPSGPTPLKAMGIVTVRDAHVLSLSLFDAASCPAVVSAIDASPLRLECRHINDQELLITLPRQTKETLDALGKLIGREAEHSKTSVRAARKLGLSLVNQLSGEDDQKRAEKAVNALTDAYVAEIDALCASKKRDLGSS